MWKKPVSLVLGGGGARGLAHIGVIKVLEAHKIPIKQIVGTSMGAVVGAVYAQYPDIALVEKKFRDLLDEKEYNTEKLYNGINKVAEGWLEHLSEQIKEHITMNIAMFRESLFSAEKITRPLEHLLDATNIQDTKIPFTAVATNLITGAPVHFKSGSIINAVACSASIPGFFPPRNYNNSTLVDGAFCEPVPIPAAKKNMPHRKVIAVEVGGDLDQDPDIDNSVDILLRSYKIAAMHYNTELIKRADVLIQPDVGAFHWSAFKEIDMFILRGEKAALDKLKQIKRTVRWL